MESWRGFLKPLYKDLKKIYIIIYRESLGNDAQTLLPSIQSEVKNEILQKTSSRFFGQHHLEGPETAML